MVCATVRRDNSRALAQTMLYLICTMINSLTLHITEYLALKIGYMCIVVHVQVPQFCRINGKDKSLLETRQPKVKRTALSQQIHCKNIRRIYGRTANSQLSGHVPLFLQESVKLSCMAG